MPSITNSKTRALPYCGTLATEHGEISFFVEAIPHPPPDWSVDITYRGSDAALIAAGVATADMIAKGRPGVRRLDADGDRFERVKTARYMQICRHKRVSKAHVLPGWSPWMAEATARWVEEYRELEAQWRVPDMAPREAPPRYLH